MTNIIDGNISSDAVLQLKEKLMNNGNSSNAVVFDKKNYLDLKLNPGETTRKVVVRILPVSATENVPFMVLHTHSMKVSTEIASSGFKSFICLNEERLPFHDNRGCPLCNKSRELLKEGNALPDGEEKKALIKAGMSFKAKKTFIVRVIERGKESEGVKFWRFNAHSDGTGVYDEIMDIFQNHVDESIADETAYFKKNADGTETNVTKAEYDLLKESEKVFRPYNIFDLNNGKDIVINLQYVPSMKKTSIKISYSSKPSPLSTDVEEANAWINDPKTWSNLYSTKSYDYLNLVAEDKIPYYDKNNSKWVEQSEVQREADRAVQEAKAELIATSAPANSDKDDDLPF